MDIVQIVTAVVLVLTLIFLAFQVVLQRRQTVNQVLVQGQELYYLLARQYIQLIRESDQNPTLNSVWLKLEQEREHELDEAQAASEWGAWNEMTSAEKQCYRYVRAAIEIFEQTFQLHQKGWIDDETWVKWRGWISLGPKMRYFSYVFADTRPRLIAPFSAELDAMLSPTARASRERLSSEAPS